VVGRGTDVGPRFTIAKERLDCYFAPLRRGGVSRNVDTDRLIVDTSILLRAIQVVWFPGASGVLQTVPMVSLDQRRQAAAVARSAYEKLRQEALP
jgi:hypothetical protein